MADPLASARAGQPSPFVNRMDTVNAVLDAARRMRAGSLGPAGGGLEVDPEDAQLIVWVRNDTGGSLLSFSVVALGTPVISAVDYPHNVRIRPFFPGTAPAAASDAFAVLLEPAGSGDIVRAAVMGVMPVMLSVGDADHTHAEPEPAVTAALKTDDTGPAKIVWKQSGTGSKWGVVILTQQQRVPTFGEEFMTTGSVAFSADNTWYDLNTQIDLPAAGTYIVTFTTTHGLQVSANPQLARSFVRVYDVTNGAGIYLGDTISQAELPVAMNPVVNIYDYATVTYSFHKTVAAPTTLRLEGKRQGGGPTYVVAQAYQPTRIAYQRIA